MSERLSYRFGPVERRGIFGAARTGQVVILGAGLGACVAVLDAAPSVATTASKTPPMMPTSLSPATAESPSALTPPAAPAPTESQAPLSASAPAATPSAAATDANSYEEAQQQFRQAQGQYQRELELQRAQQQTR